jgi:hypothetical protein
MARDNLNATPILETGWTHVAQLDAWTAKSSMYRYHTHRWIAILCILTTLFAILSILLPQNSFENWLVNLPAKVIFVILPFIIAVLATLIENKRSNEDWQVTQTASQEIQKEIYFYRTILQKNGSRRAYLEKRLAEIMRQVYRSMNGELYLETSKGRIPPNHSGSPGSDTGFDDLTSEEYATYRLHEQLTWHNDRIQALVRERGRTRTLILCAGIAGSVLAALGQEFGVWVALTTSVTAALIGWQEMRDSNTTIRNYSKIVLELTIISDHWSNLEVEEKTDAEFYRLVRNCEDVLWLGNCENIKSMQAALSEASLEQESSLVNSVIRQSVESDERVKQAMQEDIVQFTKASLQETEQKLEETFQAVLGTLSEQASSELVQQELEAMSQAVAETTENLNARVSAFTSSLEQRSQEGDVAGTGRDTSKEEINSLLAGFPRTDDIKG